MYVCELSVGAPCAVCCLWEHRRWLEDNFWELFLCFYHVRLSDQTLITLATSTCKLMLADADTTTST